MLRFTETVGHVEKDGSGKTVWKVDRMDRWTVEKYNGFIGIQREIGPEYKTFKKGVYRVLEDSEYTVKTLKTRFKAIDGASGLYGFIEKNTSPDGGQGFYNFVLKILKYALDEMQEAMPN